MCLVVLCALEERRLTWRREWSNEWWPSVSNSQAQEWWYNNVRMLKESFHTLCREMSPYLKRQDTNFRLAISVEERVAITIWRLATNSEYKLSCV